MNNEEAKEAWKELYSEIDKDNWLFVGTINPEMVVLAIKALEEKPQGEWIPISEKLPNMNGVYMVTRIIEGTPIIDASYFDGQNTWHRDTGVNHGRPYLNDIIAWQPRPEPYKEGEQKC